MTNRYPSEFSEDSPAVKFAKEILGYTGRMVGGSKSTYRDNHPDNMVIFNANVCTEELGKIWYGDLDLTLDHEMLKKLAKKLKTTIYILYESAARFDKEKDYDLSDATAKFLPKGTIEVQGSKYYHLVNDIPMLNTAKIEADEEHFEKTRVKTIGKQKKSDYKAIDISQFTLKLNRSRGGINSLELFGEVLVDIFGSIKKLEGKFDSIYMSKALGDLIIDKLKLFVTKKYNLTDKKAEREAAWAVLYLPRYFREDTLPEWIDNDSIYIKKAGTDES